MISVCLASYNGERFICQQLESILNQLDANDEIIISDNGSTDATISILKSFSEIDKRVKIFHHLNRDNCFFGFKSNHYLVSSNFENAIKRASGDIIFLSDQDDIWEDNKVSVMVKYLKSYDLVMSDCSVINENAECIKSSFLENNRIPNSIIGNIITPTFHGCCMAFHKKLITIILPFPNYLILHDTWIGVLAIKKGSFKFIEDTLIRYRRHDYNASELSGKSSNSLFFKSFYRLVLLFQIYLRVMTANKNSVSRK